jgi:predicted dehydrogenase
MKLFDPGFEDGKARIAALGAPLSIRVHDFAGRFDRYGALYDQIRPTDVPADLLAAGRAAVEARIDAALGPDHAGYRDLYFTILMLGSHDLAVLRALFGTAERVAYARALGPHHVMAILDIPRRGDMFPRCLRRVRMVDEGVEVRGLHESVRIEFQNLTGGSRPPSSMSGSRRQWPVRTLVPGSPTRPGGNGGTSPVPSGAESWHVDARRRPRRSRSLRW